jgi:ADP-ribose pyrophosphatase YjhB (NUDIX family)
VDVVIELTGRGAPGLDRPGSVVLVWRANPPVGWALPGGFVDYGETVERAAVREAAEETGLAVELVALLGVYSDPKRDDRQHNLSAVFVARAQGQPQAGDDAARVGVFALDELPEPLCFDHALILQHYRQWRAGLRPAAPVQTQTQEEPAWTPIAS